MNGALLLFPIVMLLADGSITRYKFVMTRADDKCLFFKSPRNSAGARVKLVKAWGKTRT